MDARSWKLLLLSTGCAGCVSLCAPDSFAGESSGELQRAYSAYQSGDYDSAVAVLQKLTAAGEANNATAHYYLANALVQMRLPAEALKHYQTALRLNPKGSMADYCKRAVISCTAMATAKGTATGAYSQSASRGKSSGGVSDDEDEDDDKEERGWLGVRLQDTKVMAVTAGAGAEIAGIKSGDYIEAVDGKSTREMSTGDVSALLVGNVGATVKLEINRMGKHMIVPVILTEPPADFKKRVAMAVRAPAATADSLDKSLITIHRRTGDTDFVYKQVINALALIPHTVKQQLHEYGVKVLITPTILEASPELKDEKPDGYNHGGGYDNCPGMYRGHNKTIYVAERAQWHNSTPQVNHWVMQTMLHELGHAYDHCRDLSDAPGFSGAYTEDASRLNNTQRREFAYFCQPGTRGPAELFAEMFAFTVCEKKGVGSRSDGLEEAFPDSHKKMSTLLDHAN